MHLSRVQVRRVAAVASGLMAAIYYLIGLGVLNVGGTAGGESVDLFMFGVLAGSAFLGLAALLAITDRRWLWVVAATFQVFVYFTYLTTSGIREPPFEIWGITLRLLQLPVLAALIYLSIKSPERRGAVLGEGAAP